LQQRVVGSTTQRPPGFSAQSASRRQPDTQVATLLADQGHVPDGQVLQVMVMPDALWPVTEQAPLQPAMQSQPTGPLSQVFGAHCCKSAPPASTRQIEPCSQGSPPKVLAHCTASSQGPLSTDQAPELVQVAMLRPTLAQAS
jgi:hypothetical protein